MSEITIVDDLLAPEDFITISFKGKNPFSVCTMVPNLLRDVLKVTGQDVFESDLRWDITFRINLGHDGVFGQFL